MYPSDRAGLKQGSKVSKAARPSKGSGRKDKAVVKKSSITIVKEFLSIGKDDKGTFIFIASGPGEVVSSPTQTVLRDIDSQPETGSLIQEPHMMVEPQGLTHEGAIARLRQAIQRIGDGASEMVISSDGITMD